MTIDQWLLTSLIFISFGIYLTEGLKLIVLAFFKVVAINQIFPQREGKSTK